MAHEPRVNPGYALAQLASALSRGGVDTVRKWQRVLQGMVDGSLDHGSRTPVAATPAWVTLEVARGGFATGAFVAAGPLAPADLFARNLHFLSDAGRAELVALLRSGHYRIDVPEEGALLTIAWLLERDATADAENVLEAIAPFFDRLRFYPVPHTRTRSAAGVVRLQSIADVIDAIRRVRQQSRVVAMNETLSVWNPLYDGAISLFLETVVEGEPCRRWAEDWQLRAQAFLDDYARLRKVHTLSCKPERKNESFARLRAVLAIAADDTTKLSRGDVARVRDILESFVARRGAPGSKRHAILRAKQRDIAAMPTHGTLRRIVLERLAAMPSDEGLSSLDVVSAAVTEDESERFHVPAGARLPDSVPRKLKRALEAPVDELVEQGVIPSPEVLAIVLPQLTSNIRAAALADPESRRLYASIYAAFRRRRSLLLLDLQHQVRIEELPWIAALGNFRTTHASEQRVARDALRDVTTIALTAYPETILPNKLLQELGALAKSAEIDLPIVEELAADIFMGRFTEKFVHAARIAAEVLEGSLYERYYGLSYAEVRGMTTPESLATLCQRLAGADTTKWSVARNGTIIEQQQIVTTHNLATLFARLDLELDVELHDMARRCFTWMARAQEQLHRCDAHTRLVIAKNSAYALRQMLFFLSVARTPPTEVVMWAEGRAAEANAASKEALERIVSGIRFVADGGTFDSRGLAPNGGVRFLGWRA
jgi:hypothetical protein